MFEWQSFLQSWSSELLKCPKILKQLTDDVKQSGWLGYPGASEAEVLELEQRLKKTLPPSYRDFLKTSNGWRNTSPFINKVRHCKDVDWFRTQNDSWVKMWNKVPIDVSDEDYYVYGTRQDSASMRPEYLKAALQISDVGDMAVYLLNPLVISEEGEWEAWFHATWLPGANRYKSFRSMMKAEAKKTVKWQL